MSEDLTKLTKDELVAQLRSARAELNELRSLRPSGVSGSVTPHADGRMSAAMEHRQERPPAMRKPLRVSHDVLLINKDKPSIVPLPEVVSKSYLREDFRECDTPVVCRDYASEARFSDVGRLSMDNSEVGSPGTRQDSISREFLDGRESWGGASEENSPLITRANPVGHLRLRPVELDPHRLSRLSSVGPDAVVTNNTLNVFKRAYGGDAGSAMSPQSSVASSVLTYLTYTFAAHDYSHDTAELEGFGRMMTALCREVDSILKSEPRHAAITSPAYVFGDIHGNFSDLHYFMKNLVHFGELRYTSNRFMFLGDYVDRGDHSVEVVAYLFAMKVLAPEKVFLLRGNHEDTLVSGDLGSYGCSSFRAQCRALFGTILGEDVWNKSSLAFSSLPLTGSIDGRIFCTHGGLPRFHGGCDDRLAQLSRSDFPRLLSFFQVPDGETPEQEQLRQMATDTCWSDPAEDEGLLDPFGFGDNPRGRGVILFGTRAVDHFLDAYGYEFIFRAHQEKSDGLKLSKNARVFTIFSTSAYVGHSNGAGVVLVADGKIRLIIKTAD